MRQPIAELEIRDETWRVRRAFKRPQWWRVELWARGWSGEFNIPGREVDFETAPVALPGVREADVEANHVILPDQKCHLSGLLPIVLEEFRQMVDDLFAVENAGVRVYRRKRPCR